MFRQLYFPINFSELRWNERSEQAGGTFSDVKWFVVFLNSVNNPPALLHFLLSLKPNEGSRSWHIKSLVRTIWPVKTPQKWEKCIFYFFVLLHLSVENKKRKGIKCPTFRANLSWRRQLRCRGGGSGCVCITLLLPITHLADLTPVQPSRLLEPCYVNVLLS